MLAFLDCPTGISGDMCLGATVSAGVPLGYLQESLARLHLPETVRLTERTTHKNGMAATKVDVELPHERDSQAAHPPTRHLQDIESIITDAELPDRAISWSLAIFRRLAIAEGAIHGIAPEQVHFHEVGATDAIVDIVGTCLALDWLDIDELYCAPLPTGRGTVRAAHGHLPVPAPAALKLMEMAQIPIYNAGLQGELVTPTGAAIATELATHFGDPPAMQLHKIGLGAGNKDLPMPNVLRLWVGTATKSNSHRHRHTHTHSAATHVHAAAASATAVSSSTPQSPGRPTSSSTTTEAAHSDHVPVSVGDFGGYQRVREFKQHFTDGAASGSESNTISQSQIWAVEAKANGDRADLSPPQNQSLTDGSTDERSAQIDDRDIEQREGRETVTVLETQVDDLSPQAIGYLCDRLLANGALDVFTQSVTMKKSRPGHLITVIAYPDAADGCEHILLMETTTLGVRRTQQSRMRLRRQIVAVETPLGSVRIKLAFAPGQEIPFKAHPEYEDCATLAAQHNLPFREVRDQALYYWRLSQTGDRAVNPQ